MSSRRRPSDASAAPPPGVHLATISHAGRLWDVYLEPSGEPAAAGAYRGGLRFSPADGDEQEAPVRTATIIIETTFEDALRKARGLDAHSLTGLLRSARPD